MSAAVRRGRWFPLLVVLLAALARRRGRLGARRRRPGAGRARAARADVEGARAPDRTLALTRITIQPGTKLDKHHHPGTQIAYVDAGVLTYTVDEGTARIKRGPADDHPVLVRNLEAGDTARLRAGQWIVEQPSDHHHAANRGKRPVLYLSTLFPKGAPPSIPG